MAAYSYKATDPSGNVVSGVMEAPGERGVASELQNMGLIPIRITLSKGQGRALSADLSSILSLHFRRFSSRDLLMFTQDLASLLQAGLPVDKALAILISAAEKDGVKETLSDVLKTVQGGGYLSDALARHPKAFSTFYVNMVRAGEAGGVLEAVLERLGEFLESSQDIKDYMKSAMVYPVFLVMVGGVSIIILLTFVIPRFSVIFSDMGHTIPFSTRFLLNISDLLRNYWWLLAGGGGVLFWLVRKYVHSPSGRLRFDQRKMSFPFVGDLIKKIEVARFSRTLGTLINSGVPILQAIRLVKDIITNQVIMTHMETVYDRVKEGERLSSPLRESGAFPSLAIQMITVGEETGRLDAMLLKVAGNYEKIVKNIIKRWISFLEPAMILVMGAVVAFIVISMLMAIFSMNEMPF